jgi:hypothetical protein
MTTTWRRRTWGKFVSVIVCPGMQSFDFCFCCQGGRRSRKGDCWLIESG